MERPRGQLLLECDQGRSIQLWRRRRCVGWPTPLQALSFLAVKPWSVGPRSAGVRAEDLGRRLSTSGPRLLARAAGAGAYVPLKGADLPRPGLQSLEVALPALLVGDDPVTAGASSPRSVAISATTSSACL